MAKTADEWRQTERYTNLKDSLIADLENAGLNYLPYTDLVEQYMDSWVHLQLLNEDVEERGVQIAYQNGNSQSGVTDNKSVSTAIRVGARMESILAMLGYKDRAKRQSVQASTGGGEGDEL